MAKLSYQSLLMKLRKWNEFFNEFRSPNYSTVTKRIDSNLAYYSLNYLIFLIFAFVLNGFLAPKMFIWLVLLAAIGAYVFYVQYFGVEVKMGDFTIDKTVLNIIYSIVVFVVLLFVSEIKGLLCWLIAFTGIFLHSLFRPRNFKSKVKTLSSLFFQNNKNLNDAEASFGTFPKSNNNGFSQQPNELISTLRKKYSSKSRLD